MKKDEEETEEFEGKEEKDGKAEDYKGLEVE